MTKPQDRMAEAFRAQIEANRTHKGEGWERYVIGQLKKWVLEAERLGYVIQWTGKKE